ncbi:Peptidyl-prolyl cis-trans isomerase FKBP5 [Hondaea fermentalgiana]|uniref:peptidylprolyl isomerase n=1 Tax=Hondaea fermentalgiana TaxID=2315210 RepID=A0A2R5GGS1_9STRA|nr:Peptidyl-prolyl cis-trans isomerase FKBP5 [Hondaea fermentalgiana]|eukprot:GBG30106.1 Peptidyl-prolyl cis-trans isomerase FKBP5 [Hondaea fermentalgiana]
MAETVTAEASNAGVSAGASAEAGAGGLPSTVAAKIEAATALKNEGNALLQSGELRKAARKYRTVFLYVNGLVGCEDEVAKFTPKEDILASGEEDEIKSLKVATYTNLALAYLKLDEAGKAADVANRALQLDASNIKALVRKGQAFTKLKDFDKAKAALLDAAKRDPENRAVRAELAGWKKAYKAWSDAQREEQKRLFGGALSSSATK